MKGIAPENLVFLEQSGINLSFIRRCARSLQGTRSYGERPKRKGKNVSVIGAVSLSGLLVQWSALGAIDGLTFEAFVAQKLIPKLWQGAVLVMDNCSIHKNNEELEALVAAAGARIIYLPPYSPDFSPIENCWSKGKSILRRMGARTYPDLLKALQDAFTKVTENDFLSWFTHCCYCIE